MWFQHRCQVQDVYITCVFASQSYSTTGFVPGYRSQAAFFVDFHSLKICVLYISESEIRGPFFRNFLPDWITNILCRVTPHEAAFGPEKSSHFYDRLRICQCPVKFIKQSSFASWKSTFAVAVAIIVDAGLVSKLRAFVEKIWPWIIPFVFCFGSEAPISAAFGLIQRGKRPKCRGAFFTRMGIRMVFSHFLPGVDRITNDKFAIERHWLTAFIAVLCVKCEGSGRLWNVEYLDNMYLGFFWSKRYGTEDHDGILTWQEPPSTNAMRLK